MPETFKNILRQFETSATVDYENLWNQTAGGMFGASEHSQRYLQDQYLASCAPHKAGSYPAWLARSFSDEQKLRGYHEQRYLAPTGSCAFPLIDERTSEDVKSYLANVRVSLLSSQEGAQNDPVEVKRGRTSVYQWEQKEGLDTLREIAECCGAKGVVEVSFTPVSISSLSCRLETHDEQEGPLLGSTCLNEAFSGLSCQLAFALALKAALGSDGGSLRPMVATGTAVPHDGSLEIGAVQGVGNGSDDNRKQAMINRFLESNSNSLEVLPQDHVSGGCRETQLIVLDKIPGNRPLATKFLLDGLDPINKSLKALPSEGISEPAIAGDQEGPLSIHCYPWSTPRTSCIAQRYQSLMANTPEARPIVALYPLPSMSNPIQTLRHLAEVLAWGVQELSYELQGGEYETAALPTDEHVFNRLRSASVKKPVCVILCDTMPQTGDFHPESLKQPGEEAKWIHSFLTQLAGGGVSVDVLVTDVARERVWAQAAGMQQGNESLSHAAS